MVLGPAGGVVRCTDHSCCSDLLRFDVDDPRVAEAEATMGDALQFESQFESGNLRTATVIHDRLYV